MKFRIKREILLQKLSMIGISFLYKNINILESGYLIFRVKKKLHNLKILCFNGDYEISITIYDLEIHKEGNLIIPGIRLWNICKNLPNKQYILFEFIDQQIIISAQQTLFKLNARQVTNLPMIHKIFEYQGGLSLSIYQDIFKNLLKSIDFCILDTKNVIEAMNFALIKITSNFLYAQSSDRVRLSICKLYNFSPIGEKKYEFLISKNTVSELIRIMNLTPNNLEINITIRDEYIKFEIDDMLIINKIIYNNNMFPSYTNVFYLQSYTIQVNRINLINGCVRVSGLNNEYKDKRINLVIHDQYIKVNTTNKENDKAQETILMKYKFLGKNKIIICINYDLFIDILNSIQSDEVIIKFEDDTIPLVIKDDNEHIQYIISPINY